jgi:immune inhibitor A
MAPLSPSALATVKQTIEDVRQSHPELGKFLRLKGLPKRPGINDGLIYPADKFPQGTPMSRVRSAALTKGPLRGAIRVLVVLVDFNDKPFQMSPNDNKLHFQVPYVGCSRVPVGSRND